jgi:hypothetical protein
MHGMPDLSSMFGHFSMNFAMPCCVPIVIDLRCTLEEFGASATKRLTVQRQNLSRLEEVVLEIRLKSTWTDGIEVGFRHQGHRVHGGGPPGDVIVRLREVPHERFVRRHQDLHMRARLTLKQALSRDPVPVQTLDGRALQAALPSVPQPGSSLAVEGAGMPGADGTPAGSLIITFEVVLPGLSPIAAAAVCELL